MVATISWEIFTNYRQKIALFKGASALISLILNILIVASKLPPYPPLPPPQAMLKPTPAFPNVSGI